MFGVSGWLDAAGDELSKCGIRGLLSDRMDVGKMHGIGYAALIRVSGRRFRCLRFGSQVIACRSNS